MDEDDDNMMTVGMLGAEVRIGDQEPQEIRARLYEIERRILLIEAQLAGGENQT